MKKYITITSLVLLLGTASLQAQVGINTNNPNKDAALDLNNTNGSNTKGLLLPKVALQATDNAAPLSVHTAGMKVYNTATAGTGVTAVTPGEYFNDGFKWVRTATTANAADSSDAWVLGGNTNGALKELGTKDNQPIPFRIDNTNAGLIAKTATALGYNALNPSSTGLGNTAVGISTLNANTSGYSNTAVGNLALSLNTIGNQNVALGSQALRSNTTGSENTAVGSSALDANINGTANVAIGNAALSKNTSGSYNVAAGWQALTASTTASYNTAVGYKVLNSTTTGQYNTAVGNSAMVANTTGTGNVALGNWVLTKSNGSNNVGIGNSTLQSTTTGNDNVSVGVGSLSANISGSGNTVLGSNAMMLSTTATNNTVLGLSAMSSLLTGSENVTLGYMAGNNYNGNQQLSNASTSVFIGAQTKAGSLNDSDNQIVIGYNAVGRGNNTVQIGNSYITSIGGQVPWDNLSDVRLKKDIVDSKFGLNFISKLRPVTYFMKSGTTDLQSGFIAQEVEAVANSINYKFSGVVRPQNDTDFYSLRYSEFVVPLVKAVQEQQKEIAAKDAKIAELETRLQKLSQAVDELKKN